jgi:aminopeptidase YwaD
MSRKKLVIKAGVIVIVLIGQLSIKAQNIEYARKIINNLCSEKFAGRGYSNSGDSIAAFFIANNLKKIKTKPFNDSYFQEFNISVNTFPGKLSVKINDSTLIPGYDYLVSSASGSVNGKYPVLEMNHQLVDYPLELRKIDLESLQNSFILVDTLNVRNKGFKDAINDIVNFNLFKAKGIIEVEYKKLMHVPSPVEQNFARIKLHRDAVPDSIVSISVDIENKYLEEYKTRNIAAFVPGEIDSFIVFSAHYDHLGEMGKGIYFPGANDNASGTAMVLNLAKYFAKNKKKLKYSMAFLFFSAEEMGLKGSKYYVEHPLFPLNKIKHLINLDMVGSGDKGVKIVNGTVFREEFDKIVELNAKNAYLPDVAIRGPAANSDHYPFYEKGVKSFFIYTMGQYSEYHSIYDRPKDLPLVEYEDLFRLLVDFTESF